jgi:hypothetical protein
VFIDGRIEEAKGLLDPDIEWLRRGFPEDGTRFLLYVPPIQ